MTLYGDDTIEEFCLFGLDGVRSDEVLYYILAYQYCHRL